MNISEFAGIDLQDTFVLAWHEGPEEIVFHVLAHLTQDHPMSTPPQAGDWACYRPAIIVFQSTTLVTGLKPQASSVPTTDASGSVDYGTIDSLYLASPGEYRISGEFGEATIHARSVRLFLAPAA